MQQQKLITNSRMINLKKAVYVQEIYLRIYVCSPEMFPLKILMDVRI